MAALLAITVKTRYLMELLQRVVAMAAVADLAMELMVDQAEAAVR